MNCENCGNEATVHYCLECDVLRNNRIERTPVELAAEDLFNACRDLIHRAECMLQSHQCIEHLDGDCCDRTYMLDAIKDAQQIISKPKFSNNQLLPKNPTGPDEYKSSR